MKTEFERFEQRQEALRHKRDSTLRHLSGLWQVSLHFGPTFLRDPAPLKDYPSIQFPGINSSWRFSLVHYFREYLSLEAKVAFQYDRMAPDIDRNAVMNGDDVDAQGGFFSAVPVDLQLNFLYPRNRFRLYAGFGIGYLRTQAVIVAVNGNINTSIEQVESRYSSGAPYLNFATGFYFRKSNTWQFGMNAEVFHSTSFNNSIAGFDYYRGAQIHASISYLF